MAFMANAESPELDPTRATNRNVWLVITSIFTFISGTYASRDEWMLFWVMLALWVFAGLLIAVCRPGQKPLPQ